MASVSKLINPGTGTDLPINTTNTTTPPHHQHSVQLEKMKKQLERKAQEDVEHVVRRLEEDNQEKERLNSGFADEVTVLKVCSE